jgi:murein DD-endopeptidase MepM/ murein hydrolase activator NlpD
MDKKFRISFYPKDASRIKEFSFSRRLLIAIACVIVPLAAMGAFLVLAGYLHEPAERRELRKRLALENKALENRVGKLDEDLHQLNRDLSRLEEQKVNALMISGVDYMEGEKKQKASGLFSFFGGLSPMQLDVSTSLKRAQNISAYFDSTLALLSTQGSLVKGLPTGYPVALDAIVTREFGYSPDPFTGRKVLHAGVDFSLRAGAPVFATGGGVVAWVDKDLLWGNCIKIDHGRGVETFYAHLQDILVKAGQNVVRGETLGTMGMTGVSSGVHLHYELTVNHSKENPLGYFLPELRLTHEKVRDNQAPDT